MPHLQQNDDRSAHFGNATPERTGMKACKSKTRKMYRSRIVCGSPASVPDLRSLFAPSGHTGLWCQAEQAESNRRGVILHARRGFQYVLNHSSSFRSVLNRRGFWQPHGDVHKAPVFVWQEARRQHSSAPPPSTADFVFMTPIHRSFLDARGDSVRHAPLTCDAIEKANERPSRNRLKGRRLACRSSPRRC